MILSDPLLDHPAPLPANVHAIGALLPAEGGRLDGDLEALLAAADGRSVYMSFGTTGVGGATARAFLDVWAQLPDVTVIWKVAPPPPFPPLCFSFPAPMASVPGMSTFAAWIAIV